MKTFAIGDIHGAYKAMTQCFERSRFDYKKDRLIVMGDVCDGYPEVRQCIDELLKIKHCDLVIGNHDLWALDWALKGNKPEIWTSQGGDRTMASYNGGPMPQAHIDFLKDGQLWIERNEQVFVHGGFNPDISLASHSAQALVWDRRLLDMAWKKQIDGHKCQLGKYKDIFVGHTTTEIYHTLQPIHVCNVWNLDTGAGWSGKLTLKHKNLIAKLFKKAGMLEEANAILSCDKYKYEIASAMRDAATKVNVPVGATPALLDAARRYENRNCAIFKECTLPHCEGGVWCDIYNLGGTHGRIGDAFRYLGESAYDVPLKKRRKLMLEMLDAKKNRNPAKRAKRGSKGALINDD